ncbi:MAG TPA: bifunctional riboflavin kinase/FAD synthetase [Polyangiaceae bacterium]
MALLPYARIDASFAPVPGRSSIVVIGNFDGVHRGHRAVLEGARALAAAQGLRVRVLTFDPHPAVVMGRPAPALLTTLERRAELLRRAGVDEVDVRTFDLAFSRSSPALFAEELLSSALGARIVIVGSNFRFGHKREGDFARLEVLGRDLGFEARSASMVGDERGPFSSTRAREALAAGDLDEVQRVLGRPHAFSGVVVHGQERGRTLGFPTANVEQIAEVVPPDGVYAVVVDTLDAAGQAAALGKGVMNVGVRPTVDGARKRTQEVHLFDLDRDLYDARLRVHVVSRLREERKFPGFEDLKAQIAKDAAGARVATRELAPTGGAFG